MTGTLNRLGITTALVELSTAIERVFVEEGRRCGLTQQQTHVLCVLNEKALGMGEIGRVLDLEKSSVTGMVDRLERRGLVCRRPHPDDRRASLIELTGEGAAKGSQVHEAVTDRLEALADGVPPEDLPRVLPILRALAAGAGLAGDTDHG